MLRYIHCILVLHLGAGGRSSIPDHLKPKTSNMAPFLSAKCRPKAGIKHNSLHAHAMFKFANLKVLTTTQKVDYERQPRQPLPFPQWHLYTTPGFSICKHFTTNINLVSGSFSLSRHRHPLPGRRCSAGIGQISANPSLSSAPCGTRGCCSPFNSTPVIQAQLRKGVPESHFSGPLWAHSRDHNALSA